MVKKIIDEAYEKAKEVIKINCKPIGLYASIGYQGVWARDSIISFLGASLIDDSLFKETFKASLATLAKFQGEKGQIPNAVGEFHSQNIHADYKSIDSSLWFIIGHYLYKERYKDDSLFIEHGEAIKKALTWLSYQDFGEDGMLEQLPTTDWQDAFPHKYGHVINTQALYYKVLKLIGKDEEAERLKNKVNNDGEDGLWNGEFYIPWRWKNHGKYKEKGEWFDSLGNLLAAVYELADKEKAEKILDFIKDKKINLPYPLKTMHPALKKGDKEWHEYFEDCDARKPFHYSNAGIWTYIGGFYVTALIKQNKYKEAEKQLLKLAEANLKSDFSEWLNGKTGKPSFGKKQAWNAGMYIAAYESLKRKTSLI